MKNTKNIRRGNKIIRIKREEKSNEHNLIFLGREVRVKGTGNVSCWYLDKIKDIVIEKHTGVYTSERIHYPIHIPRYVMHVPLNGGRWEIASMISITEEEIVIDRY